MGCAISKLDSDVNLQCKERKKLIKNAVRYREDFSVAHIAYIQTLKDVGRALRRFSEGRDDNDEEEKEEEEEEEKHEALMNISTHSSPSHHHVLHLTEGQEGSSTMVTLQDENLKGETFTEETVKEETEIGVALPSPPKEAPITMEVAPGLAIPDLSEGPLSRDLPLGSSVNGIASPDTARISSANGMGSPDMAGYTFSSPYRGYGFSSGPPSDRGNDFSPPFYSPRRDDSDEYDMGFSPSSISHLADQTPPPMPSPMRPETSWFLYDIFDPPPIPYNLLEHRRRRSEIDDSLDYFKDDDEEEVEVEDVNTKHVDVKNASVKDVGVMNVDVKDVDQMRKEEGIPDLEEDELDDEEEENSLAKNSGNFVVEKESLNVEDKKVKLDDKRSTDDLVMSEKGNVNAEEITMVTPKHEDAVEARESPKNELVVVTDINARDLSEAVRHIHRHFSRAHRSGQDVSSMLETQLAAHHLNGLDLKEHSKVFNAITMHWSRQATVALKDTYKDRDVAECGMFGSHAATLERLCAWEGKLYEEVKAGERTRMAFDRKRNQLYNLEAKGGDRGVIDKTRSTLTKLENRLEVALKAIELASLRIQRLTNEELYPQLAELVGGLTSMWRVMWECHKAQKAIASEMQTIENSVASDEASEAHIRATADLQRELEKWKTHFQQWIESQFNYIETLYLWLVKCLDPLDEEGDKRGHSISPNDSDLPDIIHFLASWLNALKELKTREQIAYAIDDFTGVVHSLELEQEGELFIKKNTDKHAKHLDTHAQMPKRVEMKYLGYGNDEALKSDVDTQKLELENGLRRHSEVMQDRKERTLSSFKQHLPPIFDAMASFAKDASKFYEKVHPNSREKDRS